MGIWIDFKQLRSQLKFADVLRHYHVEIKAKGNQHHGYCPLPNHNGKKNSPSFSANLEKGIFNCFGCGANGNVLDFAALMEGKIPESGAALREVAITLRDKFCPEPRTRSKPNGSSPKRVEAQQYERAPDNAQNTKSNIVINMPLDFELRNLDTKHSYLDKRGFTAETIAHFGLGYCSKGLLAGRVAIPIHNSEGKLIGYCGRLAEDRAISEEHPRYKFPPKRERDGATYEFQKLKLLYNSHRLKSLADTLAIVEGFPSVWWLTQMGFPNVVAIMGWTMSEEQASIIKKLVLPGGQIFAIPDGDDSGRRCALSIFEHNLGAERFLQWLKLDEGKQPTDYPGGWYRERLG